MDHFEQNLEILKRDTLFWSRLGFYKDPAPGDGKCPDLFSDTEKQIRFHRDFARAGVRVHSSILFSGWVGVDEYDYTQTDRIIEAVMSADSSILYMPRIKLNVPVSWCAVNPEEVFVYENGPQTAEEIKALVGTPEHNFTGYVPDTGTKQATAAHKIVSGGSIALQSFASRKWLSDAGEALRRLILHIEEGPYADRIVGYHLAYGFCGETVLWGRPTPFVGDYGICAKRAFYKWGLRKYGSRGELEKAWGQSGLSETNVAIPSKQQRQGATDDYRAFFRMSPEDRICIDYDEFMTTVNVDAMEYFARIAKQLSGNKPVGYFYGYILGTENPAYTGHLGIERALNSPVLDFFSAPKDYYKKRVGEAGGSMIPVRSVVRKKLWIEELDNQTHLISYNYSFCRDFNDSRSVMWREACKNVANGSNFWWMDLYEGAFDSEELLNEVSRIERFKQEMNERGPDSSSEVIVVADEDFYYHSRRSIANFKFTTDMLRQMGLSGTLVDIYRLKDLSTLDLKNYRFYVFLTPQNMSGAEFDAIRRRAAPDAVFFWNHVPGIACGTEEPGKLCGMTFSPTDVAVEGALVLFPETEELGERIDAFDCDYFRKSLPKTLLKHDYTGRCMFPMFSIEEGEDVRVIARYGDGEAAAAETVYKGHRNICFALSPLRPEQWAALFASAGVFLYAPPGVAVFGNRHFISVFNNQPVRFDLQLPRDADCECIQSGVRYTGRHEIPVSMHEHDASVYVMK